MKSLFRILINKTFILPFLYKLIPEVISIVVDYHFQPLVKQYSSSALTMCYKYKFLGAEASNFMFSLALPVILMHVKVRELLK